jgi:hypothetical protein
VLQILVIKFEMENNSCNQEDFYLFKNYQQMISWDIIISDYDILFVHHHPAQDGLQALKHR